MERSALPALTASVLVSCEKPTGPTAYGPSGLLTSPSRTTFSGDARVIQATVLGLPTIVLGEAGPLDASGGAAHSTLLSATISKEQTLGLLALDAEVVHAATVGQGNHSRAEASVASVSLSVSPVVGPNTSVGAELLRSQAEATCDGAGGATASGSSEIAGLTGNGQADGGCGQPNQTVTVGAVTVVINEQSGMAGGNRADMTVNALHVTVADLTNPTGPPLADVIISSAHSDIACAACSSPIGDFVTGGGWITGTPSGSRANFAVAGGMKNGALWGHLTFIDHGSGRKVKGTGVTAYSAPDPVNNPTLRHIEGTADIDGASGRYAVDVTDNGEPGRKDTFSIRLFSDGASTPFYTAEGLLAGGNIQLHGASPCP